MIQISYTKTTEVQKIVLSVLISCFFVFQTFAQISVKTIDSVQNPLADSLVRTLAGYGVSIFNVKSNIRPNGKSMGTFRSSLPSFPISSGLVMSTGIIDSIPNTNRQAPVSTRIAYSDTATGCPEGRWLLQEILKRQSNNGLIQKATEMSTIRFDLVPVGDSLKFKYVFASEEYPEFVCSQFNDIFGFFIKGPGIEGDSIYHGTAMQGFRNIARIPDSKLPVAINTVNNGQSGANGTGNNCQFTQEGAAVYKGNETGASPLFQHLAFDGLTKSLTAQSAVIPCEVYTLILVISDVGDRIYDSGVFLERGSMVSGKFEATVSASSPVQGDTLAGCYPSKLSFKRCPNIMDKWVIRFSKEGTAVANVDYKRKMPDGSLVNVPDSVVLQPGQSEENLVLEAIGEGFSTKNLVFRYLEVNQPFINGQPNFGGSETRLMVRPRISMPEPEKSVCWNDTGRISFFGPVPESETYLWKELINGELLESSYLSCSGCRNPVIQMDTVNRIFVLETKRTSSMCSRFDTVRVKARRFLLPVFLTEGTHLSITQREVGYTYRWSLNGLPVGNDSTQLVSFQPGDQVRLEISSPSGCTAVLDNSSIFTYTKSQKETGFLMVYPNPAGQEISIDIPGTNAYELTLSDLSGRTLIKTQCTGKHRLNLDTIPSGLFWLKAVSDNGTHHQTRLSVVK